MMILVYHVPAYGGSKLVARLFSISNFFKGTTAVCGMHSKWPIPLVSFIHLLEYNIPKSNMPLPPEHTTYV